MLETLGRLPLLQTWRLRRPTIVYGENIQYIPRGIKVVCRLHRQRTQQATASRASTSSMVELYRVNVTLLLLHKTVVCTIVRHCTVVALLYLLHTMSVLYVTRTWSATKIGHVSLGQTRCQHWSSTLPAHAATTSKTIQRQSPTRGYTESDSNADTRIARPQHSKHPHCTPVVHGSQSYHAIIV